MRRSARPIVHRRARSGFTTDFCHRFDAVLRCAIQPFAQRLERIRTSRPLGDAAWHGGSEHQRTQRDAPRGRRLRLRRRRGGQSLDRVDEHRRRRPIDPMRTDEAADEALGLGTRGLRIAQPLAQLPHVLVDRRRDPHAAAVLGQQVVEVNRPFLRAGELLRQHREHRPADDRRLDHRARVDADHRGRVIDRVEEVGAVLRVDRVVAAPREEHRAGQVRQRIGVPRVAVVRMRPHEDVDVAQRRIAARAQRGDPPAHERHLGARFGNEARRAGEQQERPRVGQADSRAERRAVARRPASANHLSNSCAPVATIFSAGM